MFQFQGAFVAIPTPFRNGKVDEESLRNLIEFQIANGTNGIVPCGTTGESPTLAYQEHKRVIEITIEQVNGRVPVIAGTGSNNTEEAIALTLHAKEVGADAALMISPYYNKPTQAGIYQHYKKIAGMVDIPIILYNIPGRTAVNINPDTVVNLAEIDNIVGIKEASGLMKQVMDIIVRCGPDFTVLSGEDYLTFPIMCVGGKGVISVVSNVAPREMATLCYITLQMQCGLGPRDAFISAQKQYHKLSPLCDALFVETNPAPVKAALKMMGLIDSDEVRLPLVQMDEPKRDKLRLVLKRAGLLKAC